MLQFYPVRYFTFFLLKTHKLIYRPLKPIFTGWCLRHVSRGFPLSLIDISMFAFLMNIKSIKNIAKSHLNFNQQSNIELIIKCTKFSVFFFSVPKFANQKTEWRKRFFSLRFQAQYRLTHLFAVNANIIFEGEKGSNSRKNQFIQQRRRLRLHCLRLALSLSLAQAFSVDLCDIWRKLHAWKFQSAFGWCCFDVPATLAALFCSAIPSESWTKASELGTDNPPQTFRRLECFSCIHSRWISRRVVGYYRVQQRKARKETANKIEQKNDYENENVSAAEVLIKFTSKLVTEWLILTSSVSVKSDCHLQWNYEMFC